MRSFFCISVVLSTLFLMLNQAHAVSSTGAVRSSLISQIEDNIRNGLKVDEAVTLILNDANNAGLERAIVASGRQIQRRKNKNYQVRVKTQFLSDFLNNLPTGTIARSPYPHSSNTITSQGVALTGSTDMQSLTYDGSNVKIGIIDLGFSSLSASQTEGELPATNNGLSITDYTGTGTGGIDHGTNVAEIVHDMAPGSELFLAKVSTSLELDAAVTDMISNGVQVINHSVGWFGAAFYDGTGDICEITNRANIAGMIWANSAGNSRLQHYLGDFTDTDNNLQHEFSGGQNHNTISVVAGRTYRLVLNWDAYPTTTVDYDFYVYDADPDAGGSVIASSTNGQSSKGRNYYPYPYEDIVYTADTTTTHYIVVSKNDSATSNLSFTLFSLDTNLITRTTSTSLTQPADCSSVLTVAAALVTNDAVESFSSEGPTVDGRNKPDVTGPDRVLTSLSSSFAGTSASSPHVAGALAQLIEQNPGMSNTEIYTLITNTSHDISSTGFDFRTGYGRISLDADADTVNHDDDNCRLDSNTDQLDTDLDTEGDACDIDDDNDNLLDVNDNCPLNYNPDQLDADLDAEGDVCDIDDDNDSLLDVNDNCPLEYNPEQFDADLDTEGDACDIDDDNDNLLDVNDNCRLIYNPDQLDTDLDTQGNACDADDDNDGLSDVFETTIGSNTLLIDSDGDTINDYDEVAYDGDASTYTAGQDLNPMSSDTDNDLILDNFDPIPITFNYNDGDLAPLGNPDGLINAADLIIVNRIIFGQLNADSLELSHGDLYTDGIIDMSDLILLQQLIH